MDDSSRETILVIDDEPGIADLISDFCSEMGYTVHTLTRGDNALETVKALKPQLITLDLQMPDTDGFELLKALKSDPETAHIPVIVVSILAGEAERQGLLAAAQAILAKPINFRKLRDKVDQYAKDKPSGSG